MAALILLLCFLYISAAMGYSSKYIVGGYPAEIQDFPYQVSIKRNALHDCGGALITEKFIITAAHCVYDDKTEDMVPVNNLTIFVGSTKLSGNGQTYAVEHTVRHESYNDKDNLHDIGLIGVKNKIIFNKFVKPISILRNNIPVGSMLIASGWGTISGPKIVASNTLQMLPVFVISLRDCQTELEYEHVPIENSQICTFAKINKGTCFGDSGGPLAFNGLLVGVVSWGSEVKENSHEKVCGIGKPDVNTKVSKYIKWIKTTIYEYCKTRTCTKKKLYPKFVRI